MYEEIVVRGDSIVELPKSVEVGRFNVSTKRTFKGIKEEIIAMADTLDAQGYTTTIHEGPLYLLEVSIPNLVDEFTNIPDNGTDRLAQYEYTINTSTKDILESNHPILVGGQGPDGEEYMPLEASHVSALKAWLKIGEADAKPAFDYYLGRGYGLTPITGADFYLLAQLVQATKLYYLMASGVRTIDVKLPVIRQSFQLPYGYEGVSILTGDDGKLFDHTDLLDFASFPLWLHELLVDTPDFEATVPLPDPKATTPVKKHYGWLKKVNNLGETSEGRILLVIEYHWGLWSEIIYGKTTVA